MSAGGPSEFWRGIEVSLLKQKWEKYFKGKILDLGCGEGEIAKEVFGKKIEWGLDNDAEMVEKARKSKVYKKVILADANKIALQDGVADLVFSNSVLEHIKDIDKVLKEIKRVLRRGGWLIATVPSDKLGEYLGWGSWYAWWFNQKYQHYHLYSKEKWKELLQGVGMELVDSYYYLDRPIIKQWHKLLWLNKLGIKIKIKPVKAKTLTEGAALAILARKI
jgi:ubiquinone/menaquinone biosynthesis C-methylase UbiE